MALSKEVCDDWHSAFGDFVIEHGKDMAQKLARLKKDVGQLKHENAALLRLLVNSGKRGEDVSDEIGSMKSLMENISSHFVISPRIDNLFSNSSGSSSSDETSSEQSK